MAEQTVKIEGLNTLTGTMPISGSVSSAPSGVQDVNLVSPATVPVSGTITAVPSGTQVVSGTVTTVPSGTQTVTGTVTATPTGTQAISGTVGSYPAAVPGILGAYVYSVSVIPGVAAANNYISLFNPLLSGKTIVFTGAAISSAAAASAAGVEPMRAYRTTTATLGTLVVNATDVLRIQTTMPVSSAEIRTGNPTVTLGPAFFNVPCATDGLVDPTTVSVILAPGGIGAFTLLPGEGLVLRAEAGDVDLRWNMSLIWAEM